MQSNKSTTRRKNAIALHHQKKIPEAIALYRTHLQHFPTDSEIWMNLGVAHRAQKNYTMAIVCYQRSLSINADYAACLSNLGNALKDVDRIEEAVACQARAHALAPESKLYHFNYAVALHEARHFEQARVELSALMADDPKNHIYQWERALVNLSLGNFAQGWQDYQARFKLGELPTRNFNAPAWQGEDLTSKTILVVGEQGYGDTILAARLLPLLRERGAIIYFECKPELRPVLTSLPVEQFVDPFPKENPLAVDFYVYQMSLFGLLAINQSNIPPPVQIQVPENARQKFSFLASGTKKKIGIIWSGSVTFKGNSKRACQLDRFLALAENPDLQMFSLQKGPRQKDLESLQATPLITDLSPMLNDFGDTAAAISYLDVVVMTDSSTAHLVGSMSKPIINLVNYRPYWLFLPKANTTPWYPSMELIWQEKPGDWDSVFEQLKRRLK